MKSKFQQIKTSVENKNLKIINEAFQLVGINTYSINKNLHHFFVLVDEFAIDFEKLTKIEQYITSHSNMLFINWIGKARHPQSEFKTAFNICIKA